MRNPVDVPKLQAFFREIGSSAEGGGAIYITGGATALLLGLRPQTVDVDIKLSPEPKGVFEAIARIKERLGLNVELAAPDDFIPPLPGWRERSRFIVREGQVDFFHYDFYSQALAKIQRGHRVDLQDAEGFVRLGLADAGELLSLFERITPDLIRYPSIDPAEFEERVRRFVQERHE
jgi:hypothetical protein